MLWIDWMTLGIIVVVAVVEIIRGSRAGGMGMSLFDAAGVAAAAVAATHLSGPLAQAVGIQKSLSMLVIFAVLTAGAFILGYWLYGLTGWSFQSLNGILNFLFGAVTGWAIAHMVLRILLESQGYTGAVGSMMANAPVAREIFEFRGWNALMNLLFKAKLGERTPWNVDRQGL
jgi:hypothetical protein